ncbi:hypothetical protein PO878_09160 [Iamia majanohamensis]|uniref:Uncharacterized protein n=1 Tax=Iamia majanohamensis TaxID=467976 RepID=A0AAE9YIY8_9ACTN|nr:hypothetical protein [Iamia majanohamensis]WCO68891.1 hypothetical protein PO878_09160 [Iamia majanohamensis]
MDPRTRLHPAPDWYRLRGRRAPLALTCDQGWWSPPDRGRASRRLAAVRARLSRCGGPVGRSPATPADVGATGGAA